MHGGLRYLQNFDLGLVREALLERSILVNLAPHLVHPLPLLVPSFEGKRPERADVGVGLNMYDVMARERGAWRRRRERDSDGDGTPDWSPDRHRMIDGDEVVRLAPALADREPSAAYLFYDCQTDDVRLVLTVLGEAERFGTVHGQPLRGARPARARTGRADGVRVRDAAERPRGRDPRRQRRQRDRRVGRHDPARGAAQRGRGAADPAEPRHPHHARPRASCRSTSGIIVPAGGGRSIFALPWLGRTLVGTTDNDYEGPLDHIKPSAEDVEYLLDACRDVLRASTCRSPT